MNSGDDQISKLTSPETSKEGVGVKGQEECDHEWKEVDASFDHEFGTEQVFYRECQKCGLQGESSPFSYGDEII